MSPELSIAVWLKAYLLAERHAGALPGVFVDTPTSSTTGAGK